MNHKEGFSQLAVILIAIGIIIIGGGLYFILNAPLPQSRPQSKTQANSGSVRTVDEKPLASTTIIFGKGIYDESGSIGSSLQGVDFYSINADGTDLKKLFSLNADQLGVPQNISTLEDNITFSKTNNEIYIRMPGCQSLEAVDLEGNIRNISFNGPQQCSGLLGQAISPSGSKIAWGALSLNASGTLVDQIYVANIDGSNQKLLLTTNRNSVNTKVPQVYRWSTQNPDIIYITNAYQDSAQASITGGLATLNIVTGAVDNIAQIPSSSIIWAISQDDNKVIYGPDFFVDRTKTRGIVDLLTGSTQTFVDDTNGRSIFNPSGGMVAYSVPTITEGSNEPIDNLYVYNGTDSYQIAADTSLSAWLTDHLILGTQKNAVITIDANSGTINELTHMDVIDTNKQDTFLFIGTK